jgi:creatinine amidohydrolase
MRIAEMNWMQVEEYLKRDDRCVLPVGSTEQHAHLSLATDSILAERVAAEAAEPLGVPVFPVVAYGITPNFRAYPGTVTLRVGTLIAVLRDALDALAEQGFRRVLIVNGHGGNAPAAGWVNEWMADRAGVRVRFHNWWNAPRTIEQVKRCDPVASHASWMENFPWTRLAGVAMPDAQKPLVDWAAISLRGPQGIREALGDGNFGGRYFRGDDELLAIWRVAVAETRELIAGGW